MAVTVTIPDFEFSGFYYAEILEDVIQYLRVNVPEVTDESPEEPFIQLARAFALVGHLNNVLLDMVAKERFITTASLRGSVRAHLKLIDYTLSQATPAAVDLLLELAQTFSATSTNVIPVNSKFATSETDESPAIVYEALVAQNVGRTDQVGKVFAYDASGNSYTDHTAEAQSSAGNFSPGWGTAGAAGDALYIGAIDFLWNTINLIIATGMDGANVGRWEFYDGNYSYVAPDSVTNNGTNLTFNLASWLGPASAQGLVVRVTCSKTGAFEDLTVDATNKVTSAGFFGQTAPSTAPSDYLVGSDWKPLKNLTDATAALSVTGSSAVTYDLPQTLAELWKPTTVNGVSAYWIRFRLVSSAATILPSITQIRVDTGKQYLVTNVVQGQSQSDDPLGSSNGLADQAFQLSVSPVLDDSTLHVFVTESVEAEWARVDNFLNSGSTDKHYRVDFDDDGRATVIFGDGVNGKIPAAGVDNIRATYRTMEDLDGNVGANTVTINQSGIAYVNDITNPRPAAGYAVREGSTDEDLARVKVAGPASIRDLDRAVTPSDVEALALRFEATDGTKPFARALAIEESFGPKTVECVVVGKGGNGVAQSQLDELGTYFNGDPTTKTAGKLLMNQQVTATNFVQHAINVTATVYGGSLASIQTALAAFLSPTALEDDGETFVWDFGGEVPLSRIYQVMQDSSPRPRKVTLVSPAADTTLGAKELPVVGTLTITILP